MSRNDSNFTHNSQNIPTAPFNHRAGAPFLQSAPVWVTPPPKRRRRAWLAAVLITVIFVVIGASLGVFFWATRPSPVAPAKNLVVGQAFFTNSGRFDAASGLP